MKITVFNELFVPSIIFIMLFERLNCCLDQMMVYHYYYNCSYF